MIPLVAPTITDRDRRSISSRAWNGMLDDESLVRRFEEKFAERVNCAGAVAVNSGTSALALAIEATEVRPVLIPSYTCAALGNATRVDGYVDSRYEVPSAQMTQKHATVLVHLFGRKTFLPWVAMDAAIEDYTLSLGGVPALTGLLGVCSTHASKMISTGRGGLVFGNDTALLERVRDLAYYDQLPSGRLGAHSLGMTSMQAALGLSQLAQLDEFIARRREIAATYSASFTAAGIECPDPDCGSVFFRYLIAVDEPAYKVARLADRNIEAGRGVYPPLHQLAGLPDEQFPGATQSVNRLLSVPCHPSLTDEQVRYISEQVVQVCAP